MGWNLTTNYSWSLIFFAETKNQPQDSCEEFLELCAPRRSARLLAELPLEKHRQGYVPTRWYNRSLWLGLWDPYKWPYKWVSGLITPISRVIILHTPTNEWSCTWSYKFGVKWVQSPRNRRKSVGFTFFSPHHEISGVISNPRFAGQFFVWITGLLEV